MSEEHDLQKMILEYLHALGIHAIRNNTGRRGNVSYGFKGWPDIIGHYHGRFLGIEVKARNGILSKDQIAILSRMQEDGCIAIVARSLDDVMTGLDNADKDKAEQG